MAYYTASIYAVFNWEPYKSFIQTKKTPVVSVPDIQPLENNRAYIKLPGTYQLKRCASFPTENCT